MAAIQKRLSGAQTARPSVACNAWTKVTTRSAVQSADGQRLVVEVGGKKIVVAESEGEVFAVSNKCSHLGLPLVGKTALLQGKVSKKCITCPAHGTSFSLEDGAVQGKWCPSLPDAVATGFGLTPAKPLPTFQSRVTASGDIEVDV